MSGARAFDRDRDLAGVLRLVAESRARGDPGGIFHPGGLQWWLRRVGRAGFDVAVSSENDEVVAFALHDEGDVLVQADPEHAEARVALLEWVESQALTLGTNPTIMDVVTRS